MFVQCHCSRSRNSSVAVCRRQSVRFTIVISLQSLSFLCSPFVPSSNMVSLEPDCAAHQKGKCPLPVGMCMIVQRTTDNTSGAPASVQSQLSTCVPFKALLIDHAVWGVEPWLYIQSYCVRSSEGPLHVFTSAASSQCDTRW